MADLTAFALQAACWGDPDASGLALLDPPPGGGDGGGPVGADGGRRGGLRRPGHRAGRHRLARLGPHPRLGRALLDAGRRGGGIGRGATGGGVTGGGPAGAGPRAAASRATARGAGISDRGASGTNACAARASDENPSHEQTSGSGAGDSRAIAEVVALLSEAPPREYGDDLVAALRAARRGGDAYGTRWRTEVRRLRAAAESAGRPQDGTGDSIAGLVAALAFPERVARKDGGSYLMVSGTRAELL